MPDPQPDDLRKTIARQFCQTVLWIDDQIVSLTDVNMHEAIKCLSNARHKKTRDGIVKKIEDGKYFQHGVESFAKAGVMCQLFSFPQLDPTGHDPYSPPEPLAQCKLLAKQADVLIVDWYLGSSDDAGNAKAIVNELLNLKSGTRFVFILSQKPSEADSQMSREWSDKMTKAEGSEWYSTGDGQFVCVLAKDVFKKAPDQLVEKVIDCLAQTYPDYLHWAALEISGRIKEATPRWLSALPSGTDWGILAERKYDPESDTRHVSFENLMEDLKFSVDCSSIGVVSRDVLDDKEHPLNRQYKSMARSLDAITDQGQKDAAKRLFPFSGCEKSKKIRDDIDKVSSLVSSNETIKVFIDGVNAFGGFCESVSTCSVQNNSVKRGAVYREDDASHIWICIAQSCDCLRAENLLFVKAVKSSSLVANGLPRQPKQGDTFIQFKGDEYVVSATTSDSLKIYAVTPERQIIGMTLVGFVRESILSRIAARYWGHATRVGVNQPALLRAKRKGEQ